MKELKNYIFIDMTEIALKHFQQSAFLTFPNYCHNFGQSVKSGKIPTSEWFLLTDLDEYLKTVYCLSDSEVGDYLSEFFSLSVERLHAYQKISVNMLMYYPNSYL